MASSLSGRLGALFAASCAALSLVVSATGPAAADEQSPEDPGGAAVLCSTAPTAGDLKVDGCAGRYYLVHGSAGISAGGAPLVVVVHGGYSTPANIASASGWNAIADQQKAAVVVYSRGSKPGEPGVGVGCRRAPTASPISRAVIPRSAGRGASGRAAVTGRFR
ncbi:hypothetical protein ABZV91_08190 [Nocardia sp. NPDC004568]|uniref:hypothetical protein n=1 Tax=Nocardia sp. NPDC004568 TaxID=3154551 RepID=UPI0033A8EB34